MIKCISERLYKPYTHTSSTFTTSSIILSIVFNLKSLSLFGRQKQTHAILITGEYGHFFMCASFEKCSSFPPIVYWAINTVWLTVRTPCTLWTVTLWLSDLWKFFCWWFPFSIFLFDIQMYKNFCMQMCWLSTLLILHSPPCWHLITSDLHFGGWFLFFTFTTLVQLNFSKNYEVRC